MRALEEHSEALVLRFLRQLFPSNSQRKRKRPGSLRRISVAPSKLLETAQSFFLLQRILRHVTAHVWCTERSLYYRDPLLFPRGQPSVHCSIQRVCCWLNEIATEPTTQASPSSTSSPLYTRERLRVMANGKCTLVGPLVCVFDKGTVMSAQDYGPLGCHLTSDAVEKMVAFRSSASETLEGHALLVVEKECVMRTLVEEEHILSHSHPRYILLCLKGYPCVAARQFLRRLHAACPLLPLLALTDGDPHGIAIALTTMGFTPPAPSAAANVLPITWLGVRPSILSSTHQRKCVPITETETTFLQRLETFLQHQHSTSSASFLLRQSLHTMLKEITWMQHSLLKCEMEAFPRLSSFINTHTHNHD